MLTILVRHMVIFYVGPPFVLDFDGSQISPTQATLTWTPYDGSVF